MRYMANQIVLPVRRNPNFSRYRALAILFILALAQSFPIISVRSQTYTHSVLIETFASTWCEPCRREQSTVQRFVENKSQLAHFIVYHLQDVWSTTDAVKRATELGITFVPSHAYDGGYARTSGAIVNESEIESAASRSVHLVELTVGKAINGNTLSVQVAVAERNAYSLSSELVVYAVENKVLHEGTLWNSVYRGQIVRQGLFLRPNSYEVVSGNWSIPPDTRSENLEVIAVAYDKSTSGKYGPYAIQSACSKDSEIAIPEFSGWLQLLVPSIVFMSAFILRRSHTRRSPTA
jgi:thiol-disulfide isomerase/thioredoxin